jgi:hypothetical protein
VRVDLAVVGCARRSVGRGRIDRDDEVRVLIIAVQVCWAASRRLLRLGGLGSRLRSRLAWLRLWGVYRSARLGLLRLSRLRRLRSRLAWLWLWRVHGSARFRLFRLRSRLRRLRSWRRRLWLWRVRRLRRLRGRLRWLRSTTRAAARPSRAHRDLNALVLARSRLGVDIVLAVVADRASIELSAAVVGHSALGTNSKAGSWCGTDIALELRGGRSKDATTSVGVSEASVGQAVAASRVSAPNTVLAITKLTEDTRCGAGSLKLDALLCVIASNESVDTKAESNGSESVFHSDKARETGC